MTRVLGHLVLSHNSLRLHFLIFILSVLQIRSFLVLKLSSQILSSYPFFHCAHLVKFFIQIFCLSVLKFPLEGIPWRSSDLGLRTFAAKDKGLIPGPGSRILQTKK